MFDVAVFVERQVTANHVDGVVVWCWIFEQAIDFETFSCFGWHGFCLSDGIHDTFRELDRREAVAKRAIDVGEVAAEKMMDASREDEDGGREFWQAAKNVGDAFDEERFLVRRVEITFVKFERVEATTVVVAHFSGGEDDAAQATSSADIDLVRFGDEHASMDDVPGAASGGGIFKSLRERMRKRGIHDWNCRKR